MTIEYTEFGRSRVETETGRHLIWSTEKMLDSLWSVGQNREYSNPTTRRVIQTRCKCYRERLKRDAHLLHCKRVQYP